MLIGSLPGAGKTASLRCVLLGCALDPTVELHVWELKGSGDLETYNLLHDAETVFATAERVWLWSEDLLERLASPPPHPGVRAVWVGARRPVADPAPSGAAARSLISRFTGKPRWRAQSPR